MKLVAMCFEMDCDGQTLFATSQAVVLQSVQCDGRTVFATCMAVVYYNVYNVMDHSQHTAETSATRYQC